MTHPSRLFPAVPSQVWDNWQWQLRHALGSGDELARLLGLPDAWRRDCSEVLRRYPPLATPFYLSLARSASPADPILRQCLPHPDELHDSQDARPDPLAEKQSSPVPRLVHRYRDRALFLCCSSCAVRCRHCMRKRHWQDALAPPNAEELAAAVAYLRQHREIREVLLSGGDPLTLGDDSLAAILNAFAAVPQLEVLRIGTRVPVVLPQRITAELCALLAQSPKTIWIATHFNHPWELSQEAAAAAERLLKAGLPLVNQSVLLRGVNDDAETLRQLFTGLLKIRIKPYYLFHGDPVAGTTHFRTGIRKGLEIMDRLRGNCSGLALPAFAIDLPDAGGKVRLEPDCARGHDPHGAPLFRSYTGREIPYPNPDQHD
jgi:lysine 2,3-aminomutase